MTHPDASSGLPQASTRPIATTSRPWPVELAAQRAPVWLSVGGTFLILALLLSFQQVVQGAVKQGAERHKTTALLASAVRTCKALRDVGASERCSQQLQVSNSGTAVQTAFFSSFYSVSLPALQSQ